MEPIIPKLNSRIRRVRFKLSYHYRYFGLIFGRRKLIVSLDSAKLKTSGDHAAVWLGVNAPKNKAWVQGGIMIEANDEYPSIYLEMKDANYKMLTFPWHFKKTIIVELRRSGRKWQMVAHGHSSEWITIGRFPAIDADLETFGASVNDVKAVATIGHKQVRSFK